MAICKICDRGELKRRSVHRMSTPVVVIGYILLVPSIVGMLICAALISVALTHGISPWAASRESSSAQSASDAEVRRNCIAGHGQADADLPALEEFCECQFSTTVDQPLPNDDGGTFGGPSRFYDYCSQQLKKGRLAPVSQDVATLYFPSAMGEPREAVPLSTSE